jgi:hypothetical protein
MCVYLNTLPVTLSVYYSEATIHLTIDIRTLFRLGFNEGGDNPKTVYGHDGYGQGRHENLRYRR